MKILVIKRKSYAYWKTEIVNLNTFGSIKYRDVNGKITGNSHYIDIDTKGYYSSVQYPTQELALADLNKILEFLDNKTETRLEITEVE